VHRDLAEAAPRRDRVKVAPNSARERAPLPQDPIVPPASAGSGGSLDPLEGDVQVVESS
jgi:hypothetical protein